MRILIQRVKEAKVEVGDSTVGQIGNGLLVFLGIHKNDKEMSIPWLVNKLITLRCFSDQNGKMNLSVQDIQGEVLVVSQFTLYGNCTRGRRPDFIDSMGGPEAEVLYHKFVQETEKCLGKVQTGEFGALMNVSLTNDGPVTFIIDHNE